MFTAIDMVKAAAAAIAVMALNVAVSFGVVAVYAYGVETGHDQAFYEAAARRIAPWSSVVAGAVLFFLAAYLLTKRRPQRNALVFAAAMVAVYAAIDLLVLFSEGVLASLAGVVALSLSTKLAAALAGAHLASRQPSASAGPRA